MLRYTVESEQYEAAVSMAGSLLSQSSSGWDYSAGQYGCALFVPCKRCMLGGETIAQSCNLFKRWGKGGSWCFHE